MSIFWNDGTELYHYGIQGQKWGQRRFQNADGTLTEEGRKRYGVTERSVNRAKAAYKASKWSGDKNKISAAKANYKNAKKQYAANVADARKEVYKNLSTFQKVNWSYGAVNKAAKYRVNTNDSMDKIKDRVKKEMWKNTAMILIADAAAMGAIAYAQNQQREAAGRAWAEYMEWAKNLA